MWQVAFDKKHSRPIATLNDFIVKTSAELEGADRASDPASGGRQDRSTSTSTSTSASSTRTTTGFGGARASGQSKGKAPKAKGSRTRKSNR